MKDNFIIAMVMIGIVGIFTAIIIMIIKAEVGCERKCRNEKPREIMELYKECVSSGGDYCLREACCYYCDTKEGLENERN